MGKKSSKSSNKPPKEFMPYITGGANAVNDAYNANSGKVQGYTDSIMGALIPSLTDKFNNGDAGVNAARDYGVDVLSGQYLDQGNPYLNDMIGQAVNDSTNATQAALSLKGLTGGSSYADIISRNAGNLSSNMRYADYNNERSRMDAAAGRAGQIASADYLPVTGLLGALSGSTTPIQAASQYAGGLGGLLGGYGTQSSTPSTANSIMQGVGTVASMASLFSDVRLKTDIKRVGMTDAGIPIFTYRYGGEGPFHMGVMAQEIANDQPEALGPVVDGYMTVKYEAVR